MNETERANLAVAHGLFESLTRGDWERIRQLLHADVTWTIVAKHVPGGADHQGRDHIVDVFFAGFRERFVPGQHRVDVLRSFAGGDEVAVETFTSNKLRSGGEYNNNYAWFLKIKDGKICDVREYLDTQAAAAQLG